MKIKMLQSIAGGPEPRYRLADFAFAPGMVIEVDDELARAWIGADIALAGKKSDELTMPIEVYTLRESSPLVIAFEQAQAAAAHEIEPEQTEG